MWFRREGLFLPLHLNTKWNSVLLDLLNFSSKELCNNLPMYAAPRTFWVLVLLFPPCLENKLRGRVLYCYCLHPLHPFSSSPFSTWNELNFILELLPDLEDDTVGLKEYGIGILVQSLSCCGSAFLRWIMLTYAWWGSAPIKWYSGTLETKPYVEDSLIWICKSWKGCKYSQFLVDFKSSHKNKPGERKPHTLMYMHNSTDLSYPIIM